VQRRQDVEKKIELFLDGGFPELATSFIDPHHFLDRQIDPQALTVLAGYVSRKMRSIKPAKDCPTCFAAVCTSAEEPTCGREAFLNLKSYGGLLRPSADLYALVFKVCEGLHSYFKTLTYQPLKIFHVYMFFQLEETINTTTMYTALHRDLFIELVDALLSQSEVVFVGCEEHRRALTTSVIMFYLTCRMHFICREANESVVAKKRAKADLRKLSKL